MAARVRIALAGAAMTCFVHGPIARASPSPHSSQPSSPSGTKPSDRVVVVGCLSHAEDAFLLTTGARGSAATHVRHGSNSPKASTPVTSGNAADDATGTSDTQRAAAGSNSAKASTPVQAASSASTARRTHAVMSAKGSVPIGGGGSSELSYTLDAERDQLSVYEGYALQISGRVLAPPSATASGSLMVERVKVLSSSCAQ